MKEIIFGSRIIKLEFIDHDIASKKNIFGEFDWVLFAIPAEQAANILPSSLSFHQEIKSAHMEGCFSLMLGLPSKV